MPAPRILFVKLSSLGDVVHHMPAVTELAAHMPGAHIGWAVEEAYAPLVRFHPAVAEVIPVPLRALRAQPRDRARWRRLALARRQLRAGDWDYVVDAQGLAKSALVSRMAHGRVVLGPGVSSAREGIASFFYDVRLPVPR